MDKHLTEVKTNPFIMQYGTENLCKLKRNDLRDCHISGLS